MTLQLSVRPEPMCACCYQSMTGEEADAERIEIALVGATKYAWCPVCMRATDHMMRDRNYQVRWRRVIAKKKKLETGSDD